MNFLSSVFRFFVTIAFLGLLSLNIPKPLLIAQTADSSVFSAHISEIEIKGTSDLESSQILFLIESQVGEPLSRKTVRRDIHSIYQMKLFEDIQAEVKLYDEAESGAKGYLLRFVVKERPRLAEVKLVGVMLVERSVIEEYFQRSFGIDVSDAKVVNVGE